MEESIYCLVRFIFLSFLSFAVILHAACARVRNNRDSRGNAIEYDAESGMRLSLST
jgi:hypothetical protein